MLFVHGKNHKMNQLMALFQFWGYNVGRQSINKSYREKIIVKIYNQIQEFQGHKLMPKRSESTLSII